MSELFEKRVLEAAKAWSNAPFPSAASIVKARKALAAADAVEGVAVVPVDLIRCEITRNQCGTDTWMIGAACPCRACRIVYPDAQRRSD